MFQQSHEQSDSHSRVSPQTCYQQDPSSQQRPETEQNVLVKSSPLQSLRLQKSQLRTRREQFIAKLTQFHSPDMITVKSGRNDFIKKVYTTLSLHLLVTVGLVLPVALLDELQDWVKENVAVAGLCFVLSLIILIGVLCWRKLAIQVPYNYFALMAFTVLESYVVAFVSAFYDSLVLVIAVLMGLALTTVLALYVWLTKYDFSTCGGDMVVISMSLLLFALFLVPFFNVALLVLFSFAATVAYGVFIVYDTQLIAGGRYTGLSYDDYIVGVLILHVDVIGLFLYFLRLLCTVSDE